MEGNLVHLLKHCDTNSMLLYFYCTAFQGESLIYMQTMWLSYKTRFTDYKVVRICSISTWKCCLNVKVSVIIMILIILVIPDFERSNLYVSNTSVFLLYYNIGFYFERSISYCCVANNILVKDLNIYSTNAKIWIKQKCDDKIMKTCITLDATLDPNNQERIKKL